MWKRAKGPKGEPIGHAHNNPLFDTCEYDIELMDGTQEQCQVNVIAKSMYAQVDDEECQYQILDEIVDHHKDNTAVQVFHSL